MSGTPEKILEHLLETVRLDSNGNDAIGRCLQDTQTHSSQVINFNCVVVVVVVVSFVSLQIPA